jgi:hypothetical protein
MFFGKNKDLQRLSGARVLKHLQKKSGREEEEKKIAF